MVLNEPGLPFLLQMTAREMMAATSPWKSEGEEGTQTAGPLVSLSSDVRVMTRLPRKAAGTEDGIATSASGRGRIEDLSRPVASRLQPLVEQALSQNLARLVEVRLPVNLRLAVFQAVPQLGQRIEGHVGAAVAGARFAG